MVAYAAARSEALCRILGYCSRWACSSVASLVLTSGRRSSSRGVAGAGRRVAPDCVHRRSGRAGRRAVGVWLPRWSIPQGRLANVHLRRSLPARRRCRAPPSSARPSGPGLQRLARSELAHRDGVRDHPTSRQPAGWTAADPAHPHQRGPRHLRGGAAPPRRHQWELAQPPRRRPAPGRRQPASRSPTPRLPDGRMPCRRATPGVRRQLRCPWAA